MFFPNSFIEEVKEKTSLADLVRQEVGKWDRKKSNPSRQDWWSPCPFHEEKSSSFHVDDIKGFYHCFGCGVHGNCFSWMMEKKKLTFPEAVKALAEMAGLALPEASPEMVQKQDEKKIIHDILTASSIFYQNNLLKKEFLFAYDYLTLKRELKKEIVKHFSLGYAPDGRDELFRYLKKKGFDTQNIIASGMVISPDNGSPYDRFRHRIMFPIVNIRGKVITFGGRALASDTKAKYLNGPESLVFHKSHHLYNLDKATRVKNMPLLVVEGYMDVIALSNHYIDYAVAPMGTALTEEQIKIIWKYCPEPILCFDGDKAGLNAAWRAVDRFLPLLKAGYSARFIFLPSNQDPDDYLKQNGKKAFDGLIQKSYSMSHVLCVRETSQNPYDTPERMAGLERKIETLLNMIQDARVRELYQYDIMQRVRKMTKCHTFNVQKKNKSSSVQAKTSAVLHMKNHKSLDAFYHLEAIIIGLYIVYGHILLDRMFEALSYASFHHTVFEEIKFKILLQFEENKKKKLASDDKKMIDSPTSQEKKAHFQDQPYIEGSSESYNIALKSFRNVKNEKNLPLVNANHEMIYNLHDELFERHQKLSLLKQELPNAEQKFLSAPSEHNEKRYLSLKKMITEI